MKRVSRIIRLQLPATQRNITSTGSNPPALVLSALPCEVLFSIAYFLPARSLLAWTLTSREFYAALSCELPVTCRYDESMQDDWRACLIEKPTDSSGTCLVNHLYIIHIWESGDTMIRNLFDLLPRLRQVSFHGHVNSRPKIITTIANATGRAMRTLDLSWQAHLPVPLSEIRLFRALHNLDLVLDHSVETPEPALSFPAELHVAAPMLRRLSLRGINFRVSSSHDVAGTFFNTSTFTHLSSFTIEIINTQLSDTVFKSHWDNFEFERMLLFVQRHGRCLKSLSLPAWHPPEAILDNFNERIHQAFNCFSIQEMTLSRSSSLWIAPLGYPLNGVYTLTLLHIGQVKSESKKVQEAQWPAMRGLRVLRLCLDAGDSMHFTCLPRLYPELRELHVDLSQTGVFYHPTHELESYIEGRTGIRLEERLTNDKNGRNILRSFSHLVWVNVRLPRRLGAVGKVRRFGIIRDQRDKILSIDAYEIIDSPFSWVS